MGARGLRKTAARVNDTRHVVPPDQDGARLDKALSALVPELSRARAQRLIAARGVRVNGRPARKGTALAAGDVIELAEAPGPADFDALPEPDAPLDVLHEDAACVVVAKPAGQPIHPLRPDEGGTLANALVGRFPEMAGVGYRRREPGLLHRLDTGTSGAVLAARSAEAFQALRAALRAESIDKRYLAFVDGTPPLGPIELAIAHRGKAKMVAVAWDEADAVGARPAVTEVLAVRPAKSGSEVELRARSARRHQVRVHLAAIGHPLLGDRLYDGPDVPGLARHALHASRLIFDGPASPVDVEAPLPPDLDALR